MTCVRKVAVKINVVSQNPKLGRIPDGLFCLTSIFEYVRSMQLADLHKRTKK